MIRFRVAEWEELGDPDPLEFLEGSYGAARGEPTIENGDRPVTT